MLSDNEEYLQSHQNSPHNMLTSTEHLPLTPVNTDSQNFTENSLSSNISIDHIRKIILQRKRSALLGIIVIALVIAFIMYSDDRVNWWALTLIGILGIGVSSILYIVNAANYPQPKPSYRRWNKVVYIYLAKLVLILSIIRILSNIKNILNPLHGYKDPSALSRTSLLVDTTLTASSGYLIYKRLKPAAYIEEYFKELGSKNLF